METFLDLFGEKTQKSQYQDQRQVEYTSKEQWPTEADGHFTASRASVQSPTNALLNGARVYIPCLLMSESL